MSQKDNGSSRSRLGAQVLPMSGEAPLRFVFLKQSGKVFAKQKKRQAGKALQGERSGKRERLCKEKEAASGRNLRNGNEFIRNKG